MTRKLSFILVLALLFCCAAESAYCANGKIAVAQLDTADTASSTMTTQDLGKQVDKAIKVLEVVSQELKSVDTTASTVTQGQVESLGAKISKAVAALFRVKKAMQDENITKEQAAQQAKQDAEFIKNISTKLTQTQEAVSAIQVELKKIEKEAEKPAPVKK